MTVSGKGSIELSLDGARCSPTWEVAESDSGPYDYTTLGAGIAAEGVPRRAPSAARARLRLGATSASRWRERNADGKKRSARRASVSGLFGDPI
ncbi:conserved hypothetical protein [Streptomyces sviceus ATCC 29083]|uniref:Uncharacterized protein n=1 Tax=Streptomyces sviceus (strain ATCC 29083 / DSM 924 / JCM 4929 / NBRC 13980 / NCIMB 11184 / NRRL 5439 / UC 5370) TaxID=463191 RepID=B5HWW6_STRX2|nr:conserved hypothetical protein [Streptomyces sviceus ATCC 29083]